MSDKDIRFVLFARAFNNVEAMKYKMLLDRVDIPYMIKNEVIQSLFGIGVIGTGFNAALGPIEIHVAEAMVQRAQQALLESKEINMQDIPDVCPACQNNNDEGAVKCPECGLFLG